MNRIVVISGHPDLGHSVANAAIIDEMRKELPEASVRDLGALCASGSFDIQAEQQALLDADVIVWQFPFFWYSMPAIMKKWLDEVFLRGFSHGSTKKLTGKKLFVSVTTGAPAAAYQHGTACGHTMEELLAPFSSIAGLCGLELQKPMWLNGVSYANRTTPEKVREQQQSARTYAAQLIEAIRAAAS
ncbi:MAG: NAD(P)H-dependent oxidoreductase [Succinivibrio sp.]